MIRKDEYRSTLVKQGATIGANATIVCGHTIGRHAFICAGAVVTRDVLDYALVIGVPGTNQGWMCTCGIQLPFEGTQVTWIDCGKGYEKRDDTVI